MHTKIIPWTCVMLLWIFSIYAHAASYTIQLQNGNDIKANYFNKKGDQVEFYTADGFVALPHQLVKHVIREDASEPVTALYTPVELFLDLPDEAPAPADTLRSALPQALPPVPSPGRPALTDEFLDDLNDRLSVVRINIENLNKNKQTFMTRKQGIQQEIQRLEKRIDDIDNQPYISPQDKDERIQIQQGKIADAQKQISAVDAQIEQTERMIQSQKRMESRLQIDIAKSNK